MRNAKTFTAILTTALALTACTESGSSGNPVNGTTTGGVPATGGAPSTVASTPAVGGSITGTTAAVGGNMATGGIAAAGGVVAAGGSKATGGAIGVAGNSAAGGSLGTGGSTSGGGSKTTGTTSQGGGSAVGGSKTNGGATSKGGSSSAGGGNAAGGASGGAGNPAGGSTGTVGGSSGVTVQLEETRQTIQGFGINDTWQAIPSAKVTPLFNPTSGIGLSILRIGMAPDGNAYNSGEAANISAAKSAAGSDFKVIGSVWTAPANCRDNNNRDKANSSYGGHLMASCYDSFSTSIANFASTYSLYAMGVANEPDFVSCGLTDPCNGDYDTMAYTANEMVAFIKVVGPKLKAKNVKVIAAEASEWIHQWSNISAGPSPSGKNSSDPLGCGCFGMTIDAATIAKCASKCASGDGYDYGHIMAADAAAWSAFDIIGLHQYDSQIAYAWPSDITAAKKEIWQTEMSGVKWWPEVGPTSDIANGVAVAGWIHSALAVGDASAWLWWWHAPMSSGTNDNEGLWLQNGDDTKRHYTLGNFSKFVRPGYVRVDITGNSNANLLLSAYKGTGGTVVVVAINKGTAAATVPIAIAGGTAPASCTPNVTSASANLVAGTAVTVSGGSFSASLAGTTVTTFVCK